MKNKHWHAAMASQLIERCGGLEEAAENCRVSKSVLSDAQNINKPGTMAADVIEDLEAYCGEGVYSKALAERAHGIAPAVDLVSEGLTMSEAAAHFAREIHEASKDHEIDPYEHRLLTTSVTTIKAHIGAVESALSLPAAYHSAAE